MSYRTHAPRRARVRRRALGLRRRGIVVSVIAALAIAFATWPSRPQGQPRPRFCTLAARSSSLNLPQAAQLRGDVDERSAAVAVLRQSTTLLRQTAPDEIANAVDILATISDDYFDMAEAIDFDFALLAPDARDAYGSPSATRAFQRYTSYLRKRCGIDLTTSTFSPTATTRAALSGEQGSAFPAPSGFWPDSLRQRMEHR